MQPAAEPVPDKEQAIAVLEKHGASVTLDEKAEGEPVFAVEFFKPLAKDADMACLRAFPDLKRLSVHKSITDKGLEYIKGLNKLQDLNLFDCRNVTDAGLAQLKGLTGLKALMLGQIALADGDRQKVTDAGLVHLKGLINLEFLNLSNTQVTDAGLEQLKDLAKLQRLQLDGTKVTDAGLERLKGFADLQELFVADTGVTDAGVAELKKALPKVTIHR